MAISKAERDRLKAIISDTITLLCKNSIPKFDRDFNVEGLIGITVDSEDLVLVSIKEHVKNPNACDNSGSSESEDDAPDGTSSSSRKRKRKDKKRIEVESSPAKVSRTESSRENSELNESRSRNTEHNSRLVSNSSFGSGSEDMHSNEGFNLQEVKQDSEDNDLCQIIKEEPGEYEQDPSHIVSIQSLSQPMNIQSHPVGQVNPQMQGLNVPGMPGGLPVATGMVADLNEQVELMPGSGVYVKRSTYNQLQFIDKGSKLVRKLVREIFPDVNLLASSSCMGKGETSAGLDRHKVEVIKAMAFKMSNWSPQQVDREIRNIGSNYRAWLKRKSRSEQQT